MHPILERAAKAHSLRVKHDYGDAGVFYTDEKLIEAIPDILGDAYSDEMSCEICFDPYATSVKIAERSQI